MPGERTDSRVVRRTTLDVGVPLTHQFSPPGAGSFSATVVAPAGWAFDPPSHEGLAAATNRLLVSGAGPWDRAALDRHLDRMGGTLSSRCDPESAEISVWGPESRWRELLQVLVEAARHPRLAPDDLERIRHQLIERQLRQRTQPGIRAATTLSEAIFPRGHPYRLTGTGTQRSVSSLRPSEVRRYHTERYRLRESLLICTGHEPLRTVAREADRLLRGERAGRPSTETEPHPARPTPKPRTVRVPMADRSQVEIRIGGPSVARSDDEYPAAYLANEILGGRSMLSRLFQNVREQHGLAYHASSELQSMRWGGYWIAGAGTGPERLARTLDLVRSEVRRLGARRVGTEELERIRESSIGELPLALETTAGAHELAVDLAYYGLPDDHLLTWPATLRALDAEAVRRGAAQGFDVSHAVTVVAGPRAAGGDAGGPHGD